MPDEDQGVGKAAASAGPGKIKSSAAPSDKDSVSAIRSEGAALLAGVNEPADLRQFSLAQLQMLAAGIRHMIIDVVSGTGGHLGANLGTVELTIALHHIFEAPRDKIIFDVGHQAYAHKILTGRKAAMPTLRQGGGLSGFTKRSESVYDPFGAAHAATSVSAALGMAYARDYRKEDHAVIAVIGDGAMSAGMAYEAMNNAGDLDKQLIVILNDNDMSIAPPVGAMSAYLARAVSSGVYQGFRNFSRQLSKLLPRMLFEKLQKAEEYGRGMITGGTLFEELGFYYVGPVDGHDFRHLLPVLANVRKMERKNPVLVHVVTKKGKGYAPAEAASDCLHGVGAFDKVSGAPLTAKPGPPSYTKVFASTLTKIAGRDPHIVAITAAMPDGTGLGAFARAYPERMIDVGIAEQHAVTFAGGLAAEGMKPFVAIYSTFLQRAYDSVVHDVVLQNLPVRFAIDRAGLVGADGPTHAGAFDSSYLGCLPNILLMAAGDEVELARMVHTAAAYDEGPIAFRYPRGAGRGLAIPEDPAPIEIGKGRILHEGSEVALLSYGGRLASCLRARTLLAEQGIEVTLADARFAKPLDTVLIARLAANHRLVILVEEGAIGGFASAVFHHLAGEGKLDGSCIWRSLCLPDCFIDQDKPEKMYKAAGMDAEGVAAFTMQAARTAKRSGVGLACLR